MLEKTPMRPTTQEILAQRHESSEVHDGVGCEVVELRPKEIQKSPKERVRRQRKPTVDMGGQENALTLLRLRLRLLPREPRRSMGDQSSIGQVVKICLTNRRADLVALDPAHRQAGPRRRSAPTGRPSLRLRRRFLRPLQGRRLLLHHRRRRDAHSGSEAEANAADKSEEERRK